MIPSFLAYIAKRYEKKHEVVATDALAYVFQNSEECRKALWTAVNNLAPDILPSDFSVKTQGSTDGTGRPDLLFKDRNDKSRLIIEAKFTAGFTPYQPAGYLKHLKECGDPNCNNMLLFLVPNLSKDYYKNKLVATAFKKRPLQHSIHNCWIIQDPDDHRVFVGTITWDWILKLLQPNPGAFSLFLKELERMCQLAEPDKFEPISDIESQQLSEKNNPTAIRTRNFMRLASDLAHNVFDKRKQSGNYQDAWGEAWTGTYGTVCTFQAWIGFDAGEWSERGDSPIWLNFEGPRTAEIIKRLELSSPKINFVPPVDDARKMLRIPILIGDGSREEVLEKCTSQIARIKKLLTAEPQTEIPFFTEPNV